MIDCGHITNVEREHSLFIDLSFNGFFHFYHFGLIVSFSFSFIFDSFGIILYWKMLNLGIYQKKLMNIWCIMKTKVVKSSIISKTVSQDTVSGEVKESICDKKPEIAKEVLRMPNKDKEQIDDKGIRKPNYLLENNKKRETEIEWTGKDLNRQEKFILISFGCRNRKKMARTKHAVKKRIVPDDNMCSWPGPVQTGKMPRKGLIHIKPPRKERSVPPGVARVKCTKRPHCFQPGIKALMEISWVQKSMDLLVPKRPFYRLVRELLQAERPWLKIQVSTVMALHEATGAYLI